MDLHTATETAYKNGYEAGKNTILNEVEEILDNCAHDNGEMIVRELKALLKNYKRK